MNKKQRPQVKPVQVILEFLVAIRKPFRQITIKYVFTSAILKHAPVCEIWYVRYVNGFIGKNAKDWRSQGKENIL